MAGKFTPEQRARRAAECRRWRQRNPEAFRESGRRYRAANSEKRKAYRADYDLRRYGLSLAEYQVRLTAQGGGCAICGTTAPGGKGRFHVDHDHNCCPDTRSCGRCIRGLLCHRCNVGIGLLGEDPVRFARALEYLQR